MIPWFFFYAHSLVARTNTISFSALPIPFPHCPTVLGHFLQTSLKLGRASPSQLSQSQIYSPKYGPFIIM